MKALRTYYSSEYAPENEPLFSRLAVAARELADAGLVELHTPPPLDRNLLKGLHADTYLDAFHRGVEPLASSQGITWSPSVRDATYAMLAGQVAAVQHAKESGIAMNLARGFHHAVFERGSGYCAINGLAFVAHLWPTMKVFVIDCDEHGGNGTEEFAARMPNLYNASMFGTRFGCNGNERSWPFEVRLGRDGADAHLRALDKIESLLVENSPNLVIYQAGADSHIRDPKSQAGFTDKALAERDTAVFGMARRHGIPIVFVVAGGYQSSSEIARLNRATVTCALSTFNDREGAKSQIG
jgi:acetoin utilization deacetylase AcuC-like enzyme